MIFFFFLFGCLPHQSLSRFRHRIDGSFQKLRCRNDEPDHWNRNEKLIWFFLINHHRNLVQDLKKKTENGFVQPSKKKKRPRKFISMQWNPMKPKKNPVNKIEKEKKCIGRGSSAEEPWSRDRPPMRQPMTNERRCVWVIEEEGRPGQLQRRYARQDPNWRPADCRHYYAAALKRKKKDRGNRKTESI